MTPSRSASTNSTPSSGVLPLIRRILGSALAGLILILEFLLDHFDDLVIVQVERVRRHLGAGVPLVGLVLATEFLEHRRVRVEEAGAVGERLGRIELRDLE